MIALKNKPLILTVFLGYFALLLINCVFNVPEVDALYYWDWGQHLALSYFDGPPMIAYLMRLFTELFGKHMFAINIIGTAALALESFFVYKTADLITNNTITARLATLLYAFSPYLFTRTLYFPFYDQPFLVCYTAGIYSFCCYLRHQKNQALYAIGASIGLLLLSRYNGIILIMTMLAALATQPQLLVKTFKNKHTYGAILIAALIISPVIIWNIQYHWLSFTYQLSAHHRPHEPAWLNPKKFLLTYLVGTGLPFVLLLLLKFKTKLPIIQADPLKQFLLIDVIGTFLFWLFFSRHNFIHNYYTYTSLAAAFILLADLLVRANMKRTAATLVTLFMLFCFGFAAINLWLIDRYDISLNKNHTYQKRQAVINLFKHVPANAILLTDNWITSASLDFWRPKTIQLHALPGCGLANQYSLWRHRNTQQLLTSKRPLYYVSTTKSTACLAAQHLNCQPQATINYGSKTHRFGVYSHTDPWLHLYRCQ